MRLLLVLRLFAFRLLALLRPIHLLSNRGCPGNGLRLRVLGRGALDARLIDVGLIDARRSVVVPAIHVRRVALIARAIVLRRLCSVATRIRSHVRVASAARASAVDGVVAVCVILRAVLPACLFASRIRLTRVPGEMRTRRRWAALHDDLTVDDRLRRLPHNSPRGGFTRTHSALANGLYTRSDRGRARDFSLINANLAPVHALRRRERRT
jgi:hypothetical protein